MATDVTFSSEPSDNMPRDAAAWAQWLRQRLQPELDGMRLAGLAQALTGADHVRAFVSLHVFAVWDFMSLLKRLQQELTCVKIPWMPPSHSTGTRLINDIVLCEESDDDGKGGFCSHFELYRRGMLEAQASTVAIDGVLARCNGGMSVAQALEEADIPQGVRAFVLHTLGVAQKGSLVSVAAAFVYGREIVLPTLFADILQALARHERPFATLSYYFSRHIEVDGEHHGPMANHMLMEICGCDERLWQQAYQSAKISLDMRKALWQDIAAHVGDTALESNRVL